MNSLLSILRDVAVVPSFSSYENLLHPVVKKNLSAVKGAEIVHVPDNNLVALIPGQPDRQPVALAAHLDKINHFGESPPETLPFTVDDDRVTGQMDNSVGLALAMALAGESAVRNFPPLILLFSEMEESYGLKHHPHLLREGGAGLHHGIGAERIARHLIETGQLPECVITIDTTPLFRGDRGVALYSEHWKFTGIKPGEKEKVETVRLRDELLALDPGIMLSNNTNDYLHYGVEFNKNHGHGIPSVAIEPAIHPYHTRDESVFTEDIERAHGILTRFLEKRG
ncbi:hypothetical protein QA596_05080 [Balneolales bacterium ANBcel1]|nr:hypothetical protein [Balneolales bacterium ANBcel1]